MQMWETDHEYATSVLQQSHLRVRSIALVHEKLYQSENFSDIGFDKYVEDLIEAISGTYAQESDRITINMDLNPVILNINQAIPCSLLINELIVNAYKHGFPGDKEGEINVELFEDSEGIHIIVSDNGRGVSDGFIPEESGTLGMTLINTLVDQLEGSLNIINDSGIHFDISFVKRDENLSF